MNENLNSGSVINEKLTEPPFNIDDTVEINQHFPLRAIDTLRIGKVQQVIPHSNCKSGYLIKIDIYNNPLDSSWLTKIK